MRRMYFVNWINCIRSTNMRVVKCSRSCECDTWMLFLTVMSRLYISRVYSALAWTIHIILFLFLSLSLCPSLALSLYSPSYLAPLLSVYFFLLPLLPLNSHYSFFSAFSLPLTPLPLSHLFLNISLLPCQWLYAVWTNWGAHLANCYLRRNFM